MKYWTGVILELTIFMCIIKGWAIIGGLLVALYFQIYNNAREKELQ